MAARYFQRLMSAIVYIHGLGIAHRDIKPENLLMNDTDDVIICDFGLAVSCRQRKQKPCRARGCPQARCARVCGHRGGCDEWKSLSSQNQKNLETQSRRVRVSTRTKHRSWPSRGVGTPLYAAPEVWNSDNYDPLMADVWSAGKHYSACSWATRLLAKQRQTAELFPYTRRKLRVSPGARRRYHRFLAIHLAGRSSEEANGSVVLLQHGSRFKASLLEDASAS